MASIKRLGFGVLARESAPNRSSTNISSNSVWKFAANRLERIRSKLLLLRYAPATVKFIDPVQTSNPSITTNLWCMSGSRRSPSTSMPASIRACISGSRISSLSVTTRTSTPRSCARISASRTLHRSNRKMATSTLRWAPSMAAANDASGPPRRVSAASLSGSVKRTRNPAPPAGASAIGGGSISCCPRNR